MPEGWYYSLLLVLTVLFPVSFSWSSRYAYVHNWLRAILAAIFMMLIFIPWDVKFTQEGVWGFNEKYLLGMHFFGLPIEEWLFFICIPFACIFILEASKVFIRLRWNPMFSRSVALFWAVIAVILLSWPGDYSKSVGVINLVIAVIWLWRPPKWTAQFILMYALSWIPFLLVNGALTGLFSEDPVVWYNPYEFSQIRILTIPFEDGFYSFAMLWITTFAYEFLGRRDLDQQGLKTP